MLFKIVPKFGPFKPLAFEPLTPQTERMFRESFSAAHAKYEDSLRAVRTGQLALGDVDLETGKRPARGANRLADQTYVELLEELAEEQFAGVPLPLRRDINEHYASAGAGSEPDRKTRKQDAKAARLLAALNASTARPR